MKGGRQYFALPDQDGKTVPFRHDLDAGANTGNARRTDVDHLERPSGQFGLARLDGAVDLPAIGIAFHADIHHGKTLLGRMGDVAGQENTAGAGAEGRLLLNETLQRFKQTVPFEKFEERRRLAARQD